MKKVVQFCKDSVAELKKVVWPTKEDVYASTRIVLISTIVMAIILGMFDLLFNLGINVLFR